MARLTKAALRFLQGYENTYEKYRDVASVLEEKIESLVRETGSDIHLVTARAKALDSLRSKLRRKRYSNPREQITDLIGVRVITYYRDGVDPVVQALKAKLRIDKKNSVDRRKMLDLRSFGYRSVHLIGYLDAGIVKPPPELVGCRFEIQIRSLLEHAWAEIEHEIVYKSGIEYSTPVLRMFAALAGTLELLDTEFGGLRRERDVLVNLFKDRYQNGLDGRRRLDSARLVAFFENEAPDALGWRSENHSFPFRSDVVCIEALSWVGINSADDLRRLFGSAAYRRLRNGFAADNGIAPGEVSHLALTVLAVAARDRNVLGVAFPEIVRDPSLRALVA
jgi:ppGpp synthetase/RelA/SpoT-type nucleotidyltranferase